MPASVQTRPALTGNQLKIIAMIAMTCDHVGLQIFPRLQILRILGRLALPVYAFLIAEGCRHTRNRKRYLLRLAGLGLLCQVVYFFAMRSLYQCILITFSLSVCLIIVLEQARLRPGRDTRILATGVSMLVVWICLELPRLLSHTDFTIDYGIIGVLLPVLAYFGTPGYLYLTGGLVLLALQYGGIQWFSLASLPLLMCYNGKRGKSSLGPLFYLYYPVHLVVIYGLSQIL